MKIETIGIIGAGQMGNGIAHVCARSGFEVKLLDENEETLKSSIEQIDKSLERAIKRGEINNDEKNKALSRVSTTSTYNHFKDCQLVIEAATENEQIKVAIINDLCSILNEHALIASNTSSISITRLGAKSNRPGKFVGMHFMNPVPRMELVEIIRGIATDEETYAIIIEFVHGCGGMSSISG